MACETFVIVNHSAARARAAWGEVRRALRSAGVAFDAHEARAFGDARASARDALATGYRTVAVVGGDGTLSEVVNGFFARTDEGARPNEQEGIDPSVNQVADPAINQVADPTTGEFIDPEFIDPNANRAALALLPAGTGNDFARALEGRRASLAHWIERLVAHARGGGRSETTRAVDVLRGCVAVPREGAQGHSLAGGARTFYCLNAVTIGVGAEVAARVAAQGRRVRRLPGETRFALAALPALARWRERRVRVRVDGGEARELRTNLVAVVNSRFAGGGMMFSPEARVDDGLLDVVTATRLTRAALAREMARVHAGGHVKNPRVSIVRASRVHIEPVGAGDALPVEADGDVRGHTPLELRVVPGALRVVI